MLCFPFGEMRLKFDDTVLKNTNTVRRYDLIGAVFVQAIKVVIESRHQNFFIGNGLIDLDNTLKQKKYVL